MKTLCAILTIILIAFMFAVVTSDAEAQFACFDVWIPVCGIDGQTYSNSCYAEAAGVAVAYEGECGIGMCGECISDNECPYGTRCASEVCMTSCECPMCDVCAGQCIPVSPPSQVSGTRDLPVHGAPDTVIQSCYDINVDETNVPSGLIMNEYIPSGWEVSTCSIPYSSFDAATGKINWLFFGSDVKDTKICCDIFIPSDENDGATRSFNGELVYNDLNSNPVNVPIGGDLEITVRDLPVSCDENNDWVISDFELLDYIDMWTAGCYQWDAVTGKYMAGCL